MFGKRKVEEQPLKHEELAQYSATNSIREFDPRSSTWAFLEDKLHEDLRKLREANDSLNKTPEQTAALRGKIDYIKDLLKLNEVKKPRVTQTTNYDY